MSYLGDNGSVSPGAPGPNRYSLADDMRRMMWQPPAHACYCIGPRDNQPACPCAMRDRDIIQRDGRWIEPERDLGPVT